MKKILIILFLIIPIIAWSQENNYNKAISALGKSDYATALHLLNELKAESYIENDIYKESDIYYMLAITYIEKEDDRNSSKILKEGLAKFPGNVKLVNAYCTKLVTKKSYDKSLAFINNMLVKHPENKDEYLFMKGRIYLQKVTTQHPFNFPQTISTYHISIKESYLSLAYSADC